MAGRAVGVGGQSVPAMLVTLENTTKAFMRSKNITVKVTIHHPSKGEAMIHIFVHLNYDGEVTRQRY